MRFVVLVLVCACGRIGYDELRDANVTPIDAAPDAPGVCPQGTTEISGGASTCIETAQRGSTTWIASDAACRALGRRLCTGVEWTTGCKMATGMMQATDDFEWVAENNGVVADKWGAGTCDTFATHTIDNGDYGYRCCTGKR